MKKKSSASGVGEENVVANLIIEAAAQDHRKVRITYAKKSDGIVTRTIAPYEFKDDKLYAGCKEHRLKTHSFIRSRIIGAEPLNEKYRPKFPVILAGEEKEEKK